MRMMCMEIEVPSPSRVAIAAGYAQAVEVRNGHANHQNSHQRLKERIAFL